MTRLFFLVGILGICGGTTFTNAWAAPPPIFYTPLEDEASSITALNGTTPGDNFEFVPGVVGNAFQSTSNSAGGWAQWNNTAVGTIFSSWNNSNGVTIDHYFLSNSSGIDPFLSQPIQEGMWAMVRRDSRSGQLGDSYLFTSLQNGKLRIAFANDSNEQYKFTFSGSYCGNPDPNANACSPSNQEKVDGFDIPLTDGVPYHLTVSIGEGNLKVFLDDLNGDVYSNASALYTYALPGYNWQLPPSDAVPSSGSVGGRQNRVMTIGSRGNTAFNNFGGTLRSGNWVDEVKIYNGVYTPAELTAEPTIVEGDYNGNGIVDAADYVIWRKNFPNNSGLATASMGDGNGDGNITSVDYDYWRARYGNPPGSGSGADGLGAGAQVPEPSMTALVLCACFGFAMRRRSH